MTDKSMVKITVEYDGETYVLENDSAVIVAYDCGRDFTTVRPCFYGCDDLVNASTALSTAVRFFNSFENDFRAKFLAIALMEEADDYGNFEDFVSDHCRYLRGVKAIYDQGEDD